MVQFEFGWNQADLNTCFYSTRLLTNLAKRVYCTLSTSQDGLWYKKVDDRLAQESTGFEMLTALNRQALNSRNSFTFGPILYFYIQLLIHKLAIDKNNDYNVFAVDASEKVRALCYYSCTNGQLQQHFVIKYQ